MTGLWAFEEQIPYQKYQGPPIVVSKVVRLVSSTNITLEEQLLFLTFSGKVDFKKMLVPSIILVSEFKFEYLT